MSGRVVYDSNDEIKALASYARRTKEACARLGVTDLDEWEMDYVMGKFTTATNPVAVALDLKRWRDNAAKA